MVATRVYTTSNGRPITNPVSSQRLGNNGPLLLQDFHLIDLLAHFDRERIPERVVHAKGGGAFGEFEVTDDISDVTSADFLSQVGKKTPIAIRFSTVGGEKGSGDTVRDPRGFAIKFYTQEGNFDMVMNATPVFFIRDGVKFPQLIHSQKRNPQTNLKDATAFWDFISGNQESAHQIMQLFSDRGTPASWRYMNGYSAHTYKFTKNDGTWVYMKLHFICSQFKTLTNDEAAHLFAQNPDWNTQDLFNAIQKGNYPTWTMYCQTMTPEQAQNFRWNVFDVTKVWPHSEVPLRRMGKLTLNRNPQNYFAEIEQAAFAPGHLVPGIDPSADPMLQARLFSYSDSQRHRLGVNYQQIPVNKPLNVYAPWQRDGPAVLNDNYGSDPNFASQLQPVQYASASYDQEHETWVGTAVRDLWEVTDEDFVQPKMLWDVLGRTEGQQDHFVYNVSVHLCGADEKIRQKTYGMFRRIDHELGRRIEEATKKRVVPAKDEVLEAILKRLDG